MHWNIMEKNRLSKQLEGIIIGAEILHTVGFLRF